MPARRPPVALAVGLLAAGLAACCQRGALGGGPDEEVTFVLARSLARDGDLAFDAAELAEIAAHTGVWRDAVREGPPGVWTTVFGPGQALLLAPLVAGSAERDALVRRAEWSGPLLVGLTSGLLAAWLLTLGLPRGVAVAGGLGYACCTPALPYAKALLAEPLAGLCYLVAAWLVAGVADPVRPGGRRPPPAPWADAGVPALAGLGLALAVLIRPHYVLLVPAYALLAGRRPVRLLALLTPPAVACGWWLWFCWLRFGSPLDFGYLPEIQGDFHAANLPVGLVGQLLSPGRGLLWYAPPVVLAWWGRRALQPRVARFVVGAAALQLLFYSLRANWYASWCWGPRYLMPVLPLLALPAAAAVADCRLRRPAAGLALLGVAGALAGVLVYNGLYQDQLFGQPGGLDRLLWNPVDSPLIGHWRYAFAEGGRYLDTMILQAVRVAGLGPALLLAAPALTLIVAGLWLLARSATPAGGAMDAQCGESAPDDGRGEA